MLISIAHIHKTDVRDERVEKFRGMLRAGLTPPPIRVRRWGAHCYICVDGATRCAAAWREGRLVIEGEVRLTVT